MIYLIGGTSRAGKTTVAHRFTERTGIPHFSIDYLKMGLVRGYPDLGINLYDDDGTAEKLWPILRGMIQTYVEEGEDVLMEGYYLLPSYVSEVSRQHPGQIQSCFLGFCDMATQDKIIEMRRHSPDGWLPRAGNWSDADDEEIAEAVDHLRAVSGRIRDDCRRLGLKYVELSADRDQSLDEVLVSLTADASSD